MTVRSFSGSLGIVLLALNMFDGTIKFVVAILTFAALFTSIARHCTPDSLLGVSTAKGCCQGKKIFAGFLTPPNHLGFLLLHQDGFPLHKVFW